MVMMEIRKFFRPEMLNRLDDIIVFKALNNTDLRQVMSLQQEEVKLRLAEKRIDLHMTEKAVDHVVQEAFDPSYGARPLKRYIERHIVSQLSIKLLKGEIHPDTSVVCDWNESNHSWAWEVHPSTSSSFGLYSDTSAGGKPGVGGGLYPTSASTKKLLQQRKLSPTRRDEEDSSLAEADMVDSSDGYPPSLGGGGGLDSRTLSESSRTDSYTNRSSAMHAANNKKFRY
ncbi:heat shock [Cystoisospora suis]|uniref:Heat shock n=1 Tax=Cystoisospora suis TaxID=483139 RepID=A0A2C6KFC6_9APIC|nr:heat shock [Cystoisospora suis]